jgi:hypothetical protein
MAKVHTDVDTLSIPESPEEFTEALLDDAWRAAAFSDAETTKEVLAEYRKLVNKGDEIAKQTSEQVESAMLKFLKDNGVTDLPTKAEIRKMIPEVKGNGHKGGAYNRFAPGASADYLDFESIGEVAGLIVQDARRDVMSAEAKSKVDDLKKISAQYSSTDQGGAIGGFLIPEEMRANILQLALEQSVVRGRATTIAMSSKTVDIPFVDVTSHASSLFGGMIFYWTEESAAITNTEARYGKVRLENNKYFEDDAFINGSGVGEPLGFLQSPAVIQFDRATVDTIVIGDVAGMYARMLPQSLSSAVWVVNQTALPQLIEMTISNDAVGLIGRDATQAPTMSLLGRPVIVSEKVPALANGAGNEIMFVDFSYYLVGDRQAITLDSSGHSRFSNDETELRIIERVDGRPWIQSALTPKNGDTVSPIVGLTDA